MRDLEALPGLLTTSWLGRELRVVAETGSTNADALAAARDGAPHGTVILADRQSAGRGRQGRAWHSPVGENLYLSVILRLELPPARVPPITLAAGVAVHDTVNAFGARASLKWPNDVLVHVAGAEGTMRKIAGILTEMSTRGGGTQGIVVGIGLNVLGTRFPTELETIAASLASAGDGRPLARAHVAAHLFAALEAWIELFVADPVAIARAARTRTHLVGQPVRSVGPHGTIAGVVRGVDDDGALIVDTEAGPARIVAGEIQETGA